MRKLLCILLGLFFLMPNFASAVEPGFVVYNGSREEKNVAITVDDCYNLDYLASILELAKEHDIPLTFFVLGTVLKPEDRALWQAVLDADCEIGNHSYGHADLPYLQPKAALSQLTRTQEALDETLGYHYPMQMMRPPFGHVTDSNHVSNAWVIEKAGYKRVVLWDVSQTNPDLALKAVKPGRSCFTTPTPRIMSACRNSSLRSRSRDTPSSPPANCWDSPCLCPRQPKIRPDHTPEKHMLPRLFCTFWSQINIGFIWTGYRILGGFPATEHLRKEHLNGTHCDGYGV